MGRASGRIVPGVHAWQLSFFHSVESECRVSSCGVARLACFLLYAALKYAMKRPIRKTSQGITALIFEFRPYWPDCQGLRGGSFGS